MVRKKIILASVLLIGVLCFPIFVTEASAPSLKGTWQIYLRGKKTARVTFKKSGNSYSGTFIDLVDPMLNGAVRNVRYTNDELRFETDSGVYFNLTFDNEDRRFVGNMSETSGAKRGGDVYMKK